MVAVHQLRLLCEQAKRRLSSFPYADITFDPRLPGLKSNSRSFEIFETRVSRDAFEAMIADRITMFDSVVRKTLTDARMTVGQIEEVILVGGSTRIPKVQQVGRCACVCMPLSVCFLTEGSQQA